VKEAARDAQTHNSAEAARRPGSQQLEGAAQGLGRLCSIMRSRLRGSSAPPAAASDATGRRAFSLNGAKEAFALLQFQIAFRRRHAVHRRRRATPGLHHERRRRRGRRRARRGPDVALREAVQACARVKGEWQVEGVLCGHAHVPRALLLEAIVTRAHGSKLRQAGPLAEICARAAH